MRTGKTLTLFVSNKDMNDIIQIIDSLEDSGVLMGGVTEAVKHEIRKKRFLADLLAPLATSLMQPVIGAGRGYMNKYF